MTLFVLFGVCGCDCFRSHSHVYGTRTANVAMVGYGANVLVYGISLHFDIGEVICFSHSLIHAEG